MQAFLSRCSYIGLSGDRANLDVSRKVLQNTTIRSYKDVNDRALVKQPIHTLMKNLGYLQLLADCASKTIEFIHNLDLVIDARKTVKYYLNMMTTLIQ